MNHERAILIAWTLAVGLTMQTDAAAEPTKTNTGTIGPNKGLTLEDIGKGLKSAAQNIEMKSLRSGPRSERRSKK